MDINETILNFMQSSHLIKSLIRIKGTILSEQYITRIFFRKGLKNVI